MHPVVMSQYALRSEHRSTHSSSAGDRRALRPPRSTAPRPIRGHGSGTQRTETREIPSQHPVPRHVSRTITTQKPNRIGGWPGFWLVLSLHPLLLRAVEEPCTPPSPPQVTRVRGWVPQRTEATSNTLSQSLSFSLSLSHSVGSPRLPCGTVPSEVGPFAGKLWTCPGSGVAVKLQASCCSLSDCLHQPLADAWLRGQRRRGEGGLASEAKREAEREREREREKERNSEEKKRHRREEEAFYEKRRRSFSPRMLGLRRRTCFLGLGRRWPLRAA